RAGDACAVAHHAGCARRQRPSCSAGEVRRRVQGCRRRRAVSRVRKQRARVGRETWTADGQGSRDGQDIHRAPTEALGDRHMRERVVVLFVVLAALTLVPASPRAQTARKTLDIYVVDVEGGNATLFVTPSGQSVLIDTGNGGAAAARDGDRILAAVKDASLTQIDHLITTHWHGDHFAAMEFVAAKIP